MATTARMRSGSAAIGREVEALVQPAGDEHDVVEGPDGDRRGVRRRRLGVVVPAHAVGLADELDAVRRADERGQRGGDGVRPDEPGSSTRAAAASAVGQVVRAGPGAARRPAPSAPGRADEHGVVAVPATW